MEVELAEPVGRARDHLSALRVREAVSSELALLGQSPALNSYLRSQSLMGWAGGGIPKYTGLFLTK